MSYLSVKATRSATSWQCRLFGHIVSGYGEGIPYLRRGGPSAVDGTGVEHIPLTARCDRCNARVTVAMIHERKP